MDPNEALKALRAHMNDLAKAVDEGSDPRSVVDLDGLLDHWQALDGWLSRGGFPPGAWAGQQG